jgi:hypothetical protein
MAAVSNMTVILRGAEAFLRELSVLKAADGILERNGFHIKWSHAFCIGLCVSGPFCTEKGIWAFPFPYPSIIHE